MSNALEAKAPADIEKAANDAAVKFLGMAPCYPEQFKLVDAFKDAIFAERSRCSYVAKAATMNTGAPLEEMGDEVAEAVMLPLKAEKFWMVFGIGQGVPRYEHRSKTSAQTEAKRLAGLYPEVMFVVLAVVDAYRSQKPTVNQFQIVKPDPISGRPDTDDDIPF